MKKVIKWIAIIVGVVFVLFFVLDRYSRYNRRRLDTQGVEVKAVLTEVTKSVEYIGYRPRPPHYRDKRTVYYFSYKFEVGGKEYSGKVRREKNLSTARSGDSVVVKYLPVNPKKHRLEKTDNGNYKVSRPVRSRPKLRPPAS